MCMRLIFEVEVLGRRRELTSCVAGPDLAAMMGLRYPALDGPGIRWEAADISSLLARAALASHRTPGGRVRAITLREAGRAVERWGLPVTISRADAWSAPRPLDGTPLPRRRPA